MSRGLCGLVCPPRTSERGEKGDCVKEGREEEGERERERALIRRERERALIRRERERALIRRATVTPGLGHCLVSAMAATLRQVTHGA